ncbi:sigma-70 family RNA polymerase sigma factor [Exiguobacterium sp. s192]|uniref:RNA polymerase sigma factor n=1 Tax=Exiguobacterium sp. s192 TaxID=2751206 RepID=UPI001BE59D5F
MEVVQLADLLERLEVKERSLLLLRYQADYSFQEIADLLDIPVSTVKSTLYRIIQKLQRHQMKGGESG